MSTSSKLVFFGTEQFSLPSLKALVEAGYNVVTVVTKPDFQRGRGKKNDEPEVKKYAQTHNIPVLQPNKLAEIQSNLEALSPAIGILVSYGKILPKRIINIFDPIGIINVHPSLLPKYRGPSPIEATILNGDNETGVSIMRLDVGMDSGPLFAQEAISLAGYETKPELSTILADKGAELLIASLPNILSGTLLPTRQKNSDATYTSLLSKSDGKINPETDSAHAIERQIRAYRNYPKSRLTIHNKDVIITLSEVRQKNDEVKLVIPCAQATWLEIIELIAPSGKTMSGEVFLRGYRA